MKYLILSALWLTACQNDKYITDFNNIQKQGVLFAQYTETTPFVFNGKLYYMVAYFTQANIEIRDDSKNLVSTIVSDTSFPCAIVFNNELYIYSTRNLKSIEFVKSSDLINFSAPTTVLTSTGTENYYNSSVAPGPGGFVMSYETCRLDEEACYVIKFATSADLASWTKFGDIVFHHNELSVGCPTIRYSEGFYYMFYGLKYIRRDLTFPRFEYGTDLVRSTDLISWSDPKKVLRPNSSERINNTDLDLVEYNGKVLMLYDDGNQKDGIVNIRLATWDGTLPDFLKSFY